MEEVNAIVPAKQFDLVPSQYRERCDHLVTLLEEGDALYEAIAKSDLTPTQLAMCLRRDEKLSCVVKELTIGVQQTKNMMMAEMVKDKAFELAMNGEVIEDSSGTDKNGNPFQKQRKKHPEKLMQAIMAAGDGSFRGTPTETGGNTGTMVQLTVQGVDLSVLTRKAPNGDTAVAVKVEVKPTEEPPAQNPFVDAEIVEEKTSG